MDEDELYACKRTNKEWICPVDECGRTLSRKQTLQKHLWSCHDIKAGNPPKRYKMYEVSDEVAVPKSTKYYRLSQEEQEQHPTSSGLQEVTMSVEPDPLHENTAFIPQLENTDIDIDVGNEEELIDNFVETFGPPLYVLPPSQDAFCSPINQYHHYMTMCAFANHHNLSDRGFRHLIHLMGLHIPAENLMETNVDNLKKLCGFEADFLQHHLYCGICKKLFSGEVDQCKTPGCTGRKEKKSTNYFVTGSLDKQLTEILERDGIWSSIQSYAHNRPEQHGTISDIVDGEMYKKLKEPGGFLDNKTNITLSFFTDGIPLFQSSKVSLWPVYLLLNELPPKQRFTRKNMVLWGVWQGCGKPAMNMFLRPLVEDLNQLYLEGIIFTVETTTYITRAMMVVATMDLQARAYVFQTTQHNGEYGCLYCLEPGIVVKSGKGNCRSYPTRDLEPSLRTKESLDADADEAILTGKRIRGICSKSALSCLSYFDPTSNVVIDYMHGILLGIMKKLMTLWFDSTNNSQPFHIGDQVHNIDKILSSVQPPYYLRRLPRKISGNYSHWKASELRSWLLYYSLPCLNGFLPDIYLKHFSLLVEATFILLGEGISAEDLRRADILLKAFVKHIGSLYGENVVGLNVHNLTHLTSCVKMWGPLWAWSCFVFESFNGEIKKSIHGTGNACRQIFWSLHSQKKVEALAINCEDENLKFYYRSLTEGSTTRQKGDEEAYQCSVFTPTKITTQFTDPVKAQLKSLFGTDSAAEFLIVKKISRNGFLMFSKHCTRVMKRNSYTIKMIDGAVGEVDYFIMEKKTRRVMAVCLMLEPLGPFQRNRLQHLQTFKLKRGSQRLVKAEFLQEPVVVVTTQAKVFCSVLPNNVERD